MADSAEALNHLGDVSRETIAKFQIYADLLRRWQSKMNLVANSTLNQIWNRHFADSAQLLVFANPGECWADLGSGAGFPGLPVAIMLSEKSPDLLVHLIERDNRKCAFLRQVARETGTNVAVHHGDVSTQLQNVGKIDILTSRAVAPLDVLLSWAAPILETGAKALFLKGQDVDSELTKTTISSQFDIKVLQSRISSGGCIVVVTSGPMSSIR
jgi:16S rRNA (guanine527-N7)-methyltransferase